MHSQTHRGGPTRHLATQYGCRVTGLDITEEYCEVATLLAERTGLVDRLEYRHGDALDMPFEDGSFDRVWTQHASMNIAEKARLFGEMYRVLIPAGRLLLYDIVASGGGGVYYPVPWARDNSISFLAPAEQVRKQLEGVGFRVLAWRDETEGAIQWFRTMVERVRTQGRPPIGLHLLLGPDFTQMAANVLKSLEEDRVAVLLASLVK